MTSSLSLCLASWEMKLDYGVGKMLSSLGKNSLILILPPCAAQSQNIRKSDHFPFHPAMCGPLERLRLGLVFRGDTRLEGLDGRSNVASGAVAIHDER